MAQDWLADVRKYVADADEGIVKGIVRYCGIALTKVDSSLVSFSDSKETDRVRNNFLKKKLGLTDPDSVLDAAIAAVGERMKADRTKNRVTVYYLLAENFGKLDLFAGKAKAAAAGGAAAAAGAAAAGVAALSSAGDAKAAPAKPKAAAKPKPAPAPEVKAAPVAAAPVAAAAAVAAVAAAPAAAKAASSDDDAKPAYAAASAARYDPGTNWALWGALFIGGIILAGVLAMMISATRNKVVPMPVATAPAPTAPAPAAPVAAPAPVAVPQGSGVLASERDNKPMLTVYFDTGKSAVAPDFPAVSAPVKAYLDANPASKLAVSGFNDPTGNAAANARLSKNRAQSVKAAFEKLGIAPDRVLLEKPPETSGTGVDNAASRRVEAVIKE